MSKLILLNKPFQVMSQFSPSDDKRTLADFIKIKDVYPAGRLDYDSEGLLLLTDDGLLNQQIANPKHKAAKTYLVQIEGLISDDSVNALKDGVELKDGLTKPAEAKKIDPPSWLWERPIRERKNIPTCWIELKIKEGKNRQVRRMCANVGHPCLRLIRSAIGDWDVSDILPGEHKIVEVKTPKRKSSTPKNRTNHKFSSRQKKGSLHKQ